MKYRNTLQKGIGYFFFIALSFFTSCKDEEPISLPDPVTDGLLNTGHPRMILSEEHLASFKTKLTTPQWNDLVNRMNSMIETGNEEYGFGAIHFAVAYAVTGEQKYADQSKEIIFRIINEPGYCDVTSSYLRAPGCTGQVALASDILFARLTDAEKNKIFDYLEFNAKGIVNLEGWSGWGWQDGNPDYKQLNNYYPGHLQTILHYALLAYNHRELARDYYRLVVEEELPAALDLVSTELKGGHGAEGTWYDDKLMGHYAEVVLMLREATNGNVDFGNDYAGAFADYVTWRMYSIMNSIEENGKQQLYDTPTGDQPAVAEAKVMDLTRLRLWALMAVLKETEHADAAGFIKHFEQTVNFESKGWQREFQLDYLLHYDATVTAVDFTNVLSKSYFSPGKGVAHYRTGWDNDAMNATIHFSPSQGQRNSHWHFGEGAFYIWHKGWQADHLNRVPPGSGVEQNTALMNTLLVNGDVNSQGAGDASVLFFSGDDHFMAVKGEATDVYNANLEKFERTFIATDNFITVYDKVVKKNVADVINFIVNSENGFTLNNNVYTTQNKEGQLTVKTMIPGGVASSKTMGVTVDFETTDAELNILHAIQAGDIGSSSATTLFLEAVQSDAGSYFGIQFLPQSRAYVHLVNKTDNPASSLTYTASFGAGAMEHVITGVEPGQYTIQRDGNAADQVNSDEMGTLYFETSGGGTFQVFK